MLLTHLQKYDPFTLVLDLGGSYRTLMQLLGGQYLRIGLTHQDVRINPFSLPPTPEHRHFLAAFVRTLVQSGGQYTTTMQDDRDIHAAVEHLYVVDPDQRRLFTLANLLPRPLAQYLHRWIQDGPYAELFDQVEDTLSFDRVQCLDFEGMDQYPLVLEPLLFYVLHRATTTISDPAQATRLKVCVLDEAWRFVRDETLRAYITEALKTWRKKHASMLLATQSADDFASTGLLQTVVESCPTKLLLANPGLDADRYQRLFHLNAAELQALMTLIPRRQFLLKRPTLAKVLTLDVDPRSYWLYTVTPLETERVRALVEAHGLDTALDLLTTQSSEALHARPAPLAAHADPGADRRGDVVHAATRV